MNIFNEKSIQIHFLHPLKPLFMFRGLLMFMGSSCLYCFIVDIIHYKHIYIPLNIYLERKKVDFHYLHLPHPLPKKKS